MQIDVLSQNTLKLTLSRLDMFDLDIKYESLSGKNPDTKRLLSHVLRTVKHDKSAGVDFTGERLFVEAFPRPDGGCMLYISCLIEGGENDNASNPDSKENAERRTVRLSAKSMPEIEKSLKSPKTSNASLFSDKPQKSGLLCRLDSLKELNGVCKCLSWQLAHRRLEIDSALYGKNGEYRLFLLSDNKKLISSIVSEYGELLKSADELPFTYEHYNLLVPEKAVEKMNAVL
ncbi:MAG: adaptor protein MecA [Oscillospiraceae bacterium]|nr:adaptor protein MecA [Oscillospiraceae bacterium]